MKTHAGFICRLLLVIAFWGGFAATAGHAQSVNIPNLNWPKVMSDWLNVKVTVPRTAMASTTTRPRFRQR